MPTDPQPELIDITADGTTAIVSLQENNLIAVVDLTTATVVRYIDAGVSIHARADITSDGRYDFTATTFVGQLQPDSVCLLADGVHFVTANEGDTPNNAFGAGVFSGGRGFSVFSLDGTRVYDSGDAAEYYALRAGAYSEGRSGNRGIEVEGCGSGVFAGVDYAFLLGERDSSLFVVDASTPSAPVIEQILGAPMRPEAMVTLPGRGLIVVGGEGNVAGGGIWIYQAVADPIDAGHGADVYSFHSDGTPFSAFSALAYDPSTGDLLAAPDNAFAAQRIWWFAIDHGNRRAELVRDLALADAAGNPLLGYDPEGLAINPDGGYVIASEGIAGNGGSTSCQGSIASNRILFFDAEGRLDPTYGAGGIVDLPCGTAPNAIDWSTVRVNGYEGVAVVDRTPGLGGGLLIYVAFQRALTTEGQNTRIGEYDADTGTWRFYYYTLEPNPGGAAGSTFLSELLYVGDDRFAVVERDQGWAGGAGNKTIRTFSLSTGTPDLITDPVDKETAYDLLAGPFRFDEEKIEGLALGGGSLWVVNDNDGGRAASFLLQLDPSVLAPAPTPGETTPGAGSIVLNEVRSSGTDFIELYNRGSAAIDLGGWRVTDNDPTHIFVIPAGTNIAAGGTLLLDGDPMTTSPLHFTFGLGSADSAVLYTPPGVIVDQQTWTAHVATASRCPDGSGAFVATATATPGALNACTP